MAFNAYSASSRLQPRPVVGRFRQQELDHAVLYRPDDLLAGPVVGVAPLVQDVLLGFGVHIHADLQRPPQMHVVFPALAGGQKQRQGAKGELRVSRRDSVDILWE